MRSKTKIPIKSLESGSYDGIAVGWIPSHHPPLPEEDTNRSHRHDFHLFLLQEKGVSVMEVDFESHKITGATVFYIHPNQVHRILRVKNVKGFILAVSSENIHAPYLNLLEEMAPAKPLALNAVNTRILKEAASLCATLSGRKQQKLYAASLKESCNTLITLMISQYLEQAPSTERSSRFESVARAFRQLLERNYISLKRPGDYARLLNISVPYLNECVRNTTGFSVSHHIHQRVILEAMRLLYHDDVTVKEIAATLGYDDHAYFSRLFTKTTGMSALAFRRKNLV